MNDKKPRRRSRRRRRRKPKQLTDTCSFQCTMCQTVCSTKDQLQEHCMQKHRVRNNAPVNFKLVSLVDALCYPGFCSDMNFTQDLLARCINMKH